MELKLNPGDTVESPTASDVEEGIRGLPDSDDAFAILASEEQHYIQTSGHPGIGFIMEYREGGEDDHFHCVRNAIPADQVVDAFLSFLRGDSAFKTDFPWAPGHYGGSEEPAPVKFRYVVLAFVLVAAFLAYRLWFAA